MTQLQASENLKDIKYCILDVETTGLDSNSDHIIEVAGVQYSEDGQIDTFSSLVRPSVAIPEQITYLTGITDADVLNAPDISTVSSQFQKFISTSVVVGHNINFDIAFLKNSGVIIANEIFDTLDMAYVLEPSAPSYNLARLAEYLGIQINQSHRALVDCMTTLAVFRHLVDRLRSIRLDTFTQLNVLSRKGNWGSSVFLNRELNSRVLNVKTTGSINKDENYVDDRIEEDPNLNNANTPINELNDIDIIDSVFGLGGLLDSELEHFEPRREQVQMAEEVFQSFQNGSKSLIEAGTGVGKSMAYLVPALKYSVDSGNKVVVSTNTITLQDQIINQDLPIASKIMRNLGVGKINPTSAVLKGRRNYLCLNRLMAAINKPSMDRSMSLLLAKILIWLETTNTGDVAEINISRQAHIRLWGHLNSEGASRCAGWQGKCFLRSARGKAESANVIVVNHSLLMSDMVTNNSVIPDYKSIVVDEGHHIENKATEAFGFEISKFSFEEIIDRLQGRESVLNIIKATLPNVVTEEAFKEKCSSLLTNITYSRDNLKTDSRSLFEIVANDVLGHSPGIGVVQHRLTDRSSIPNWDIILEISRRIIESFRDIKSHLTALSKVIEGYDSDDRNTILMEIEGLLLLLEKLNEAIDEFIFNPSAESVYWINSVNEIVSFQSALIDVSNILRKTLFDEKESVVITSATLSYKNSFEHFETRTGFQSDKTTILGSPFDYQHSALLLVPNDVPDHRDPSHDTVIAKNIYDAAEAAGGRTVGLFTSYKAMNNVYDLILPRLDTSELSLHAQGRTGSPDMIIQSLRKDTGSIVLGTSTFWEGIDLRGDALQVLVITRLPFEVPTDPVVQARSEAYSSPFMDYSVPNAVNRFRQGFGRLIRSKEDVGVVILLDPRIVKSRYGSLFIKALPEMEIRHEKSAETSKIVSNWLGN